MIFLRLGLTSFGGPVAHLGYLRTEFVERRRWLSESAYADLVALCQFLPGPASSQLGMALGLRQGGLAGAVAAWLGFSLPSALAMTLCGLGLATHPGLLPANVLHGLKIAAVAVVAHAVWRMPCGACRVAHGPQPVPRPSAVVVDGNDLCVGAAVARHRRAAGCHAGGCAGWLGLVGQGGWSAGAASV